VKSGKVYMSSQNNNKLYSTPQERLNTVIGENGLWWAMLQKAQIDYLVVGEGYTEFQHWLADHYGIQIHYDSDGILPTYDILDADKHLLFKLKYA
jgi:hypothetical protein